ncbi:MAG: lipoate--protein ligase family protein [Acidimicrobiales bacterium]
MPQERHGWRLERRSGLARQLHRWAELPCSGRLVRCCQVLDCAVVLGSTQSASDFDEERARARGLALVRRRSGGGAVLVAPGAQLWVDFFIPSADPLFEIDVARSFRWVGEAWAGALRATFPGATIEVVDTSSARRPKLAASLCFAGRIPGEVTLGGRKAVGCSQRRTRDGAWIHTVVMLESDGGLLASVLGCPEPWREEAARVLDASSAALREGLSGGARGGRERTGALLAALLACLPPLVPPGHRLMGRAMQ